MNTLLINAAADLICQTMQTHRTPAGIAAALDAARMLQSPGSAAETERLRDRVAELVEQRDDLLVESATADAQATEPCPWQRAVNGLNSLVDAGIPMHVEPDGHISNPCGTEHIEWDRTAERWRLIHDDDPGPTVAESAAKLRRVLAPSAPAPQLTEVERLRAQVDRLTALLKRAQADAKTALAQQAATEQAEARRLDHRATIRAAGGDLP